MEPKTIHAKAWLMGQDFTGFNEIAFNTKQAQFVNLKDRHSLFAGGMASGKTLGWMSKFALFTQIFPGSTHLIGRKTKENAIETFMKDFRDIFPSDLYEFKVGDGKLLFSNGTIAEFWGLDAMVNTANDTRKAEQKLKSHNFNFAWVDQLEEIEERVYTALDARVRGRMCKHHKQFSKKYRIDGITIFEECTYCGEVSFNQINSTTNPATYWGYEFFKGNPNPMAGLVETSMLDNQDYLPEATIQSYLSKPKKWVERYVYGKWEPWSDEGALVFNHDSLQQQRVYQKTPIREFGGIKIFAEPDNALYQIGLDPSEGSQDPCGIVVVNKMNGQVVASYTGFVPAETQAEKAIFLAEMYSKISNPLIIPESNGVGAAVLEHLKKRYDKIYVRETFNTRENKETQKLGWNTSHSSKSLLISQFSQLLERQFPRLHDSHIVDEFLKFEYTNEAQKKGAGATNGNHDDMVMATLLAYWDIVPPTQESQLLSKRLKNQKPSKVKYQYS